MVCKNCALEKLPSCDFVCWRGEARFGWDGAWVVAVKRRKMLINVDITTVKSDDDNSFL